MHITKKDKLERFDQMDRERRLLERYFWDSRSKLVHDAKAVYRADNRDVFRAFAYGTDRGDGGYIVVESYTFNRLADGTASLDPGVPSIQYYNDWTRKVSELPHEASEYCTAMRSLAEQIRHELYLLHNADRLSA